MKHSVVATAVYNPIQTLNKGTAMDQPAKAWVMGHEYKSNDGKATDLSKQAQSEADKNDHQQVGCL